MKKRCVAVSCGILTGVALFGSLFTIAGASAVLKYEKSSDVQFTFNPILALELSGTTTACGVTSGNPTYCISGLAPGNSGISNVVNVKVKSNSAAGWTLRASVGGASKENPSTVSYSGTDLELAGATGTPTADGKFEMIASGVTSLSDGKWGYTIDSGTNYMDLPYYTTDPNKIINQTVDAAGNPPTGSSYIGDLAEDPTTHEKIGMNTQIGAYAKATQISGTYANVVNYTATVNIPSRQVTVVAGTDVASVSLDGSTTTLTKAIAEGDTVPITATCTSGNNFAGWNVSPEYGSFADRNNASTNFTVGPHDVTITAYCGDIFMQGFSATGMNIGDTITLKDARDNQTYTVAKLADGNVWMTENLRLDPTTVDLNTLKGNTNATDQILTYFKNGGGSSPYPASGVVAKTASGGSWTDSYDLPFVATAYKDTTQAASGSASAGKIGVYYNYCAASAGSYCYASGAGSGNAQYDICPSGWKMPTGDTAKGSYYYLYNTGYSANAANFLSALSIPLSGYFLSGSANNQGSNGSFWSSTRSGGDGMYLLNVNASNVYPQYYIHRYFGFSVRCIANS